MSKGHNLQDPFLNVLRKERIPVSIFLVNGIKLQGYCVGIQADGWQQYDVSYYSHCFLYMAPFLRIFNALDAICCTESESGSIQYSASSGVPFE